MADYDWRQYCADKHVSNPISKEDLIDGAYYVGQCRNTAIAKWFAKEQVFKYWRRKFSDVFLDEIRHPQDDRHFDVFIPIRKADEHDITLLHDEIK